MIIITNEMLDKAFGDLRVNGEGEIYSWSVQELSKRDIYGKGIKYVILYDGCSDPQKYVDNWMKSSVADMEAAEYFNTINMEDDNMNKYETLLKKYGALYKDFEDYRTVTEGLATEGVYIKNEALAELLEIKDKFNSLYKVHKVYCSAAEDVTVKLIETEEKCNKLTKERDGLKMEKDNLYKSYSAVKKDREKFAQEVVSLRNTCKEKMDKIKQRDKQITKLIDEKKALHTLYIETAKERDEYAKRLEHINAMSNLEWKFEVVEETETTRTAYDKLVDFCNKRYDSCIDCPNKIACDGINMGLKPAKWNEDEIAEYNELMALCKEDK